MVFTASKMILTGILLLVGGMVWLVAFVVFPDFLYGVRLFGGILGLLAPFGLVALGALLTYGAFFDMRRKKKTR